MDGQIYTYHAAKTTGREAYAQTRTSQIAAQHRERERGMTHHPTLHPPHQGRIHRTIPHDSLELSKATTHELTFLRQDAARRSMEFPTSSDGSSASSRKDQPPRASPFEFRNGRRYLRGMPYPMPCDLGEIQRQDLRTLLGCKVFGRTVCSPNITNNIPRKVLDMGCGSGYWSALCHDYFSSLGAKDVSFTGLDAANLAPDLRKHGVNWTFVQHDFRRVPLPFDDGEFDLVMLKDLSLTTPLGLPFQRFLDENIRILKEGGTLEIWEADHVFRSILPHTPPLHAKQPQVQEIADKTGTFLMAPGTPFAPAQNKFLVAANKWITEALDRRRLPAAPCTRIAQLLLQEPDHLQDLGVRRIAIPLGGLYWDPDEAKEVRTKNKKIDDWLAAIPSRHQNSAAVLSEEQQGLRQAALMTVLQMVENMEPLLREASSKNVEEWAHWWASMMADLLDPAKASLNGECLEIGAWWATKVFGGDTSEH